MMIVPARAASLVTALATLALPHGAWGYDPATTHPGLTQRAALASTLHGVLSRRLGRPLGLFEPISFAR